MLLHAMAAVIKPMYHRSNERNVPFTDLARQYEQEFLDDMGKLGVEPPDVLTRVSEVWVDVLLCWSQTWNNPCSLSLHLCLPVQYIPAVIDMISRIIKNGFGYESNGSVYFDTVAYDKRRWDYGKLFPEKLGNEQFQEEGEGEKPHWRVLVLRGIDDCFVDAMRWPCCVLLPLPPCRRIEPRNPG